LFYFERIELIIFFAGREKYWFYPFDLSPHSQQSNSCNLGVIALYSPCNQLIFPQNYDRNVCHS
jgi:hypothetical protein